MTTRTELIARLREEAKFDIHHETKEAINLAAAMLEADELMRLANVDCIAWFDALKEDYDKLKAAARLSLDALEEATTYTSSPSWSPSMTDDCNKAIAALKEVL